MLKGLNGPGCGPFDIVAMGDRVFFGAGHELWASDGSIEGTVRIKQIPLATAGSQPSNLTPVAGSLFFIVNAGAIWTSDGTPKGIRFWEDPGALELTALGDHPQLFISTRFLAEPGYPTFYPELWVTDSTYEGTVHKESADVNNDGTIDISDGIYLLEWLFLGGAEPPAPGPA